MTSLLPPASLLVAAAIVCAGGCATTTPPRPRQASPGREAREIELGQQHDPSFQRELGLCDNPALQQYVQQLGDRLAAASRRPRLPWRFVLVDVAAPNTFALPGGVVYVTRGMLPYLNSEAELAAVVAHEIGHVAARQVAREYRGVVAGRRGTAGGALFSPQARLAGGLVAVQLDPLFVRNTPEEESRAESLEVRDIASAGWDPESVLRVLSTLGRLQEESDRRGIPTWVATHPQPPGGSESLQALAQKMEKGKAHDGPARGSDIAAYHRMIDGLVFGDDPRDGFVRGLELVHPALGVALQFPQRWPIANWRGGAFAASPDGKAVLLLHSAPDDGTPLRGAAIRVMQAAGFSFVTGDDSSENGIATFVATYVGALPNVGEVAVRAAHFVVSGHRLTLAGISRAPLTAAFAADFDACIASIRALPREAVEAVRPNRLALYTAAPGDTWERIARDHGGVIMASALAALNGREAGDPPVAGEQLKIVVPG